MDFLLISLIIILPRLYHRKGQISRHFRNIYEIFINFFTSKSVIKHFFQKCLNSKPSDISFINIFQNLKEISACPKENRKAKPDPKTERRLSNRALRLRGFSNQNRLKLFLFESAKSRFIGFFKIADNRKRLALGRVLPHRNEIDMLSRKQGTYVFRAGRERIV